MRDKLIRYVELLFAGAPNEGDIRQEILQNTLDRYDDLIAQGKSPEAAYSLSISGIGDISELLHQSAAPNTTHREEPKESEQTDETERKKTRAGAIFLYILSPVPLFILSDFGQDVIGLCFTLILIAAATYLMVMTGKPKPMETDHYGSPVEPDSKTEAKQEIRRSVRSLIWAVGLAVYFIMSFVTNAWYITWVIFPLIACVQGLVIACMDLKEAS